MRNVPTPREQDRLVAARLAVLAVTVLFVALALVTSGGLRVASIVTLGLLVPGVAAAGTSIEHRKMQRRVSYLEDTLREEHANREEHDRVFNRVIDELNSPLKSAHKLAMRLESAETSGTEHTREHVRRLAHDAIGIAWSIENVATGAQLEAGTYRSTVTVVELDRHVSAVVTALDARRMRVSHDVRPALVRCDPVAVRLILLNVLNAARTAGATSVRIGVEERHGLGILSIADDRESGIEPDTDTAPVLDDGTSLPLFVGAALVEHQGGTMSTVRTLGWTNTVIRFPVATPAQTASSLDGAGIAVNSATVA